jgi:prepilin-type N-terminal cleavage/methylation domain-containing protein
MHTRDRRKRRAHAFSLVELLVVLGVIGTLSAITTGVIVRARQVSRGITCANNLRQIATGLLTYYTQYDYIPPFTQTTLPVLLADVISEPQVFICPSSPYPTGDSYSQYYVPRDPTTATGFLLGCPNHTVENSTFGAFGAGLTLKGKTEPVLWNNQPVAPGSQVTGGTLTFADGTTVTINSGVNVIVLVSFDEGQGRIYSAVKIPTGSLGTIQVQAAHGTHFDVATPACTAGVRGTQFTVTTSNPSGQYETNVAVTEGTVWVDAIWPAPSAMALPAGSSHTFTLAQAAAPATPSTILVTGPSIGVNEATWTIANVGSTAFTINQISLAWPTSSILSTVTLNGNVIFNSGLQLSSDTVISSGWQGSSSLRSIGPGQAALLTVQTAVQAAADMLAGEISNTGTYSLSVQ